MEEQKLFKTVNSSGIAGIASGIVILVAGLACAAGGIVTLIYAGRLMKARKHIVF